MIDTRSLVSSIDTKQQSQSCRRNREFIDGDFDESDELGSVVPVTAAGAGALLRYAAEHVQAGYLFPEEYRWTDGCSNNIMFRVMMNAAQALEGK